MIRVILVAAAFLLVGPANAPAKASPRSVGAPSALRGAPPSAWASIPATFPTPLAWQSVPSTVAVRGGAGADLRLFDVTIVPGGLIAIGGDRLGGVILSSPDGVQWTRAADNASLDGALLTGLARGAGLTAIIGRYPGSNRGFLWVSPDGANWHLQGAPFTGGTSVTDIAASPTAYVVSGTVKTRADATGTRRTVGAVWTSADGHSWDQILLPAVATDTEFRPTLVRYAGSRFVAFGRFIID